MHVRDIRYEYFNIPQKYASPSELMLFLHRLDPQALHLPIDRKQSGLVSPERHLA